MEHLGIDVEIIRLASHFGGIVLALSLAVGLGSKEVVSRSWERHEGKSSEELEQPFKHL